MEERNRSPLRLLAPASILVFVLAFLLVVVSAGPSEKGDTRTARQSEQRDLGNSRDQPQTETQPRESTLPDDVYVVKAGDTLGAIAERVGITVENLMQLNPDLDPQALVSGQQIKLKE